MLGTVTGRVGACATCIGLSVVDGVGEVVGVGRGAEIEAVTTGESVCGTTGMGARDGIEDTVGVGVGAGVGIGGKVDVGAVDRGSPDVSGCD